MAHEVSAKMHTKVVAHKDLEIEVKTINGGKPAKPHVCMCLLLSRKKSLF